ncbi:MAG: septum site-determining protein MinC [Caldilineaceae bacterium]
MADFQMPPAIVDAIADAVQSERRAARPEAQTRQDTEEIAPAVHSTVLEHPSAPDLVQLVSAPPYLYRGTLRSGQIFRHAGSVIVVGDVNPGAQVVSGSDVYIWGRLRGVVHAGAMGDEKAVIGALDFEPVQVRIGGFIAMSPRGNASDPGRWFWKRQATDRPELAHVVKGQIVVDQWDARIPK